MALKTPLTELLGIEHPVMLAGMGGVSFAPLVAAVSEAGGFGTLGMASQTPDAIREQMREVKRRTRKPFGVDLLAARPETLEAACNVMIEEGATAFISGLGVPVNIMERLQKAGVIVMNMCGTVAHAVNGEEAGVDAVVAQGGEAGGHTGDVAGMALIPQCVDAVKVPVVAAGAINDGRGLAAALAFGACGVWVGTRFIASREANATNAYHRHILEAKETETVRTRSYSGKPMRVRRNAWTAEWEKRPQDLQPFPAQRDYSMAQGAMRALHGYTDGLDESKVAFPMGQGAGGIHDILPAAEIVHRMVADAEAIMQRMMRLRV